MKYLGKRSLGLVISGEICHVRYVVNMVMRYVV